MSRYGWIGFWVQLTLSVVSGVILLFSVAFTSQVRAGSVKLFDCYSNVWDPVHMLAGLAVGNKQGCWAQLLYII
jgi:hypothetical protein